MEYLIVSDENDVTGGVFVSDGCEVKFNVPWRLILAKGIAFPSDRIWDEQSLEIWINQYGASKGGNRWKDVKVVRSNIPAGCFYPRIARPSIEHPLDVPSGQSLTDDGLLECRQALGQFRSLVRLFDEIASVIHPAPANFFSYGPQIRNLLLLACTEFEAIAKAVLRENSYGTTSTNVKDYEKLEKPMKLSEYKISFTDFPEIGHVQPFEDWGAGRKLSWYGAYNDTKHDRHKSFSSANLGSAVSALAGCFAMLVASYGYSRVSHNGPNLSLGIEMVGFPQWELGDLYRYKRVAGGGNYDLNRNKKPMYYSF